MRKVSIRWKGRKIFVTFVTKFSVSFFILLNLNFKKKKKKRKKKPQKGTDTTYFNAYFVTD